MKKNHHIRILSLILAVMVLSYAATYIFDRDRAGEKNAFYVWLDEESSGQADRVEIKSRDHDGVDLVLKDGNWFVNYSGENYPAKAQRVRDLFDTLARKDRFPVRAASVSAHERLGVADNGPDAILLSGGVNPNPLFGLLSGGLDAAGRETYLRERGRDEVRSGPSVFSPFIRSQRTAWYDLRLFAEAGGGLREVQALQRIRVRYPQGMGGGISGFTLSRNEGGWTMEGVSRELDTSQVDTYARSILNAEGNDFLSVYDPGDSGFTEENFPEENVILEFGDGSSKTLSLGQVLEDKQYSALVRSSPYVYSLAEWTVNRIFRNAEELYKKEAAN